MLMLRLRDIAGWTRGTLVGDDVAVTGVSTDSRNVGAGELFVALQGEFHDGHDHVAEVAKRGAAGVLVARRVESRLPQIVVADTLRALGDLAAAVRARRDLTVVGITGSNGKTTVKALTAGILERVGVTHSNAGNFNNEIGLPLTLLAMPQDAHLAVLEMGAGKPGDIAYLAAIAQPRIGLVNNVGPAHLERMHSLQGIAETKGALYQALPADGIAVINADDAFAAYFTELAGARRTLRFGLDAAADVAASGIHLAADYSDFELRIPADSVPVHLPLPGRHNVANALAAAALAHAVGANADDIAAGLQAAQPVGSRLRRHVSPAGWVLIDDSYNANPVSVRAALATLALQPGERWLVLGDMAELGPGSSALHAGIGRAAREQGIEHLYVVGTEATHAGEAFGAAARAFPDQGALIAALRHDLHAGVTALVKGSHSSHMDKVAGALVAGCKGVRDAV